MILVDLTGKRFGRLVVLSRSENLGPRARWLAQCDCGSAPRSFGGGNLKNGKAFDHSMSVNKERG